MVEPIMLVVAGMLALLCVIAVVHPFLRRGSSERGSGDGGETDSDTAANYAELESMLDSIQTLQLERQLDNIPEDAYREQLRAYRLEAASLLWRIDQSIPPAGTGGRTTTNGGVDPEQDLERQVLVARLASNGVNGAGMVCPGCGKPLPGQGAACPVCGQAQPAAGTRRSGVSEE